MPISSMIFPAFSGVRSYLTPSSLSTSELPLALDTPLLPCFATNTPPAASTKAAVVEMLKVFLVSPPVPQLHITGF